MTYAASTHDSITVSATATYDLPAVCSAYTDSTLWTSLTAEQVFLGTSSTGFKQQQSSKRVATLYQITGLKPDTSYQVYCSLKTASGSYVKGPQAGAFRTKPAFAPALPTMQQMSFSALKVRPTVPHTNDRVRCCAYTSSRTRLASDVFACNFDNAGEAAPAVVTTGSILDFQITKLPSPAQYYVLCATESGGISSSINYPSLQGFGADPVVVDSMTTKTSFTVTITVPYTDSIRCASYATTFLPSSQSNIWPDAGPLSEQDSRPNQPLYFRFSGLITGVQYVACCSGEFSTTGACSPAVLLPGFMSEPQTVTGSETLSRAQITYTVNPAEYVRCCAFSSSNTPAAVVTYDCQAINGAVGASDPAVMGTGQPQVITFRNLPPGGTYNIWCATRGLTSSTQGASSGIISDNPVVVTTGRWDGAPAILSQDTTSSTIKAQISINKIEGVRCGAYRVGSNIIPQPQQLFAGQGSASFSEVLTPSTQNEKLTFTMSGLQVGLKYVVYCATAETLSPKSQETQTVGFTAGPALDPTKTGLTTATVSVSTTANSIVRCGAYRTTSTAPTADSIMQGIGAEEAPLPQTYQGSPLSFNFVTLTPKSSYYIWCASEFNKIATRADNAVPVTTVGWVQQPKVETPVYASSVTLSASIGSNEELRCAVYPLDITPSAADLFSITSTNKKGSVGVTPQVQRASNAAIMIFTITGLDASSEYRGYCATVGALSNPVSVKTPGFLNQPSIEPNSVTLTGVTVQLTARSGELVKCAAYNVGDRPDYKAVYSGTGAQDPGGEPQRSGGVDQKFVLRGVLKPGFTYNVWCATFSQAVSVPVPFTTGVWTQSPEITSGSTTQTTAILTTKISVADWIRCAVFGVTVNPSAAEVYNATGAAGSTDAKQAFPDSQVQFEITGLPKKGEFKAWCATRSGSRSESVDLVTVDFLINPPELVGSSIPSPDRFQVQTVVSGDEFVNCGAYQPSSQEPTAADVYAGTRAVQSAGELAALPNQQVIFTFQKVSAGTVYIWCATKRGALSRPLKLDIPGFIGTPLVSGTYYSQFDVSVQITSTEMLRCIAVPNGSPSPSAIQVFQGLTASGIAASAAPAPKFTVKGEKQIFTLVGLESSRTYDTYCATGSGAKSGRASATTQLYSFDLSQTGTPPTDPSTQVSVSVRIPLSGNARCVAVKQGQNPTAEEVMLGYSGGSLPAQGVSSTVYVNANSVTTFLIENLSPSTRYDIICAASFSDNFNGQVVSQNTASTYFRSKPLTVGSTAAPKRCSAHNQDCNRCLNDRNNDCVYNQQTKQCVERSTCSGPACYSNSFQCGNPYCVYSEWGEWSKCSKPCATGFKTRQRTVLSGMNDPFCNDSHSMLEDQPCNTRSCNPPTLDTPPDLYFDEPTYNEVKTVQLTGISNNNDEGQEIVSVTADSSNTQVVSRVTVDYKNPDTTARLSMTLNAFVAGESVITVQVTDFGDAAAGPMTTKREFRVTVRALPEDCVWEWTEWTSCSATCRSPENVGTRTRQSNILTEPQHGGRACPSPALEQQQYCNTDLCPVCDVEWGPWSACDVTCGNGKQTRSERVRNTNGGLCRQLETETRPCLPRLPRCGDESCANGRCGLVGICGCDHQCQRYGDCCFDYVEQCRIQTCSGRCGAYIAGNICQCDRNCLKNGDCCPDFTDNCGVNTCQGRCGQYTQGAKCQCNAECTKNGNCCADFAPLCTPRTCTGRCGANVPGAVCQCDSACKRNGNCCEDYFNRCEVNTFTCRGRCGGGQLAGAACQCHAECVQNGNCCFDYQQYCSESSCLGRCGAGISNALVVVPQSSPKCSCRQDCLNSANCCPDYQRYCYQSTTCAGRCGQWQEGAVCQCNDECLKNGNCCPDYYAMCNIRLPTCDGRCGINVPSAICQCTDNCAVQGNCCPDYINLCNAQGSCAGRCNGRGTGSCWCDQSCILVGDCCPDYFLQCSGVGGAFGMLGGAGGALPGSCVGRCNRVASTPASTTTVVGIAQFAEDEHDVMNAGKGGDPHHGPQKPVTVEAPTTGPRPSAGASKSEYPSIDPQALLATIQALTDDDEKPEGWIVGIVSTSSGSKGSDSVTSTTQTEITTVTAPTAAPMTAPQTFADQVYALHGWPNAPNMTVTTSQVASGTVPNPVFPPGTDLSNWNFNQMGTNPAGAAFMGGMGPLPYQVSVALMMNNLRPEIIQQMQQNSQQQQMAQLQYVEQLQRMIYTQQMQQIQAQQAIQLQQSGMGMFPMGSATYPTNFPFPTPRTYGLDEQEGEGSLEESRASFGYGLSRQGYGYEKNEVVEKESSTEVSMCPSVCSQSSELGLFVFVVPPHSSSPVVCIYYTVGRVVVRRHVRHRRPDLIIVKRRKSRTHLTTKGCRFWRGR